MKKASNEFDPFLNECQIYVWEWYIPEQKVRFGIPSLNSLWIDDQEKNIKLATMLERVHPDDIQKVLVRRTSPLYRSDKMFEVDLRINVAAELMPDGQSTGRYEWYGFRGKTQTRDRHGRPTYVRGVAINLDQRYRAQERLIDQKTRQLQNARNRADYSSSVIQEVGTFLHSLAENADTLIAGGETDDRMVEDRLVRLSALKDQVSHILELTDKVRFSVGAEKDSNSVQDVQQLSLWEHMAELLQVYSLKAGSRLRFYFSNLYDNQQIYVDVRLFNLLLDNVINALIRTNVGGRVVISYVVDKKNDMLSIRILCSDASVSSVNMNSSYNLSSFGLSVSRIIAKRIWGDITVDPVDSGGVRYTITLPVDARNSGFRPYSSATILDGDEKDVTDVLDEIRQEQTESVSRTLLPQVLIGMCNDASLYRNQHLFEVTVKVTTDDLLSTFVSNDPHIVFVDNNLPGTISVNHLIAELHKKAPDTPIVVTDDVAPRSLHKQVQQLGARYMLTNPLTLRKVNMMIKRFLK